MNYCTKCASYYQTPGTCNCFAAARPPIAYPWAPTYPYPTWVPYTPTTPTITFDTATSPLTGGTWYVTATALPPTQPITSGYSVVT